MSALFGVPPPVAADTLEFVEWDDEPGRMEQGFFFPVELVASDDGITEEGSNALEQLSVSSSKDTPESRKRPKGPASEEEKKKKRAAVAAASRATRAKRKQERQTLKERNDKLEKDREAYLARIAQLQTEVQTLRDHGTVDLKLENDLLRAEIRKYKGFMFNLVSAAKETPDKTEEETYRLAKRGSDSAKGQIMGLAYTSLVDPSWVQVDVPPNLTGDQSNTRMLVQTLPLGCKNESGIKRVNMRFDLGKHDLSCELLRKKIWKMWQSSKLTEDALQWVLPPELKGKVISEVKPVPLKTEGFEDGPKEDHMRVIHYLERPRDAETAKVFPSRDSYFVCGWHYSKIHDETFVRKVGSMEETKPINFSSMSKAEGESSPDASIIMSCATTISNMATFGLPDKNVIRVESPLLEGHIIRPTAEGCHWTAIWSVPLSKTCFAGLGSTSERSPFGVDGTPSPDMWSAVLLMLNFVSNVSISEDDTIPPLNPPT